ncbi:MAG: hypothetical protein ACK4TG_05880 [Thermaurantiacus sp.]
MGLLEVQADEAIDIGVDRDQRQPEPGGNPGDAPKPIREDGFVTLRLAMGAYVVEDEVGQRLALGHLAGQVGEQREEAVHARRKARDHAGAATRPLDRCSDLHLHRPERNGSADDGEHRHGVHAKSVCEQCRKRRLDVERAPVAHGTQQGDQRETV